MVQSIIKSKILLGLTKAEVINKLGGKYFTLEWKSKDNICYFYSNGKFFDGCDILVIEFNEEICVEASYGGCG